MILLHEEMISRAELAKRTSLSSSTVTNLVAELINMGVVAEINSSDTRASSRSVGRPRRILKLIPDARYAIGVHIGIGLFRVVITNLHAEIIHNRIVNYDLQAAAEETLGQITDTISQLITEKELQEERIIGIGVGASGLVDPQNGVNVMAPQLGWQNINIRQSLSEKTGFPVFVDNNVRAMAIGEAYFGAGRGAQVLAFVYGRMGVGAGFVVNGRIFRGSGAGAGEIGHTIMIPDGGHPCRCGNRGCLETLVSEPVIVCRAQELAENHPDSLLAQLLQAQDANADQRPIDAIFFAARQGDKLTGNLLAENIRYLGVALANLVDILNPEIIILGGMFAEGADVIIPIALETIQQIAFGGLGEKVLLTPTSSGWRAGAIGAAALALMEFFYQRSDGTI